MWAIKFLKGPQMGQIIELRTGENILGRSPKCNIRLISHGVSKEHAKLIVKGNSIMLDDLGSRNGTFLNGSKIRHKEVKIGDRIAVHDVIFEIIDQNQSVNHLPSVVGDAMGSVPSHVHGAESSEESTTPPPRNFIETLKNYFETVALPGVYKLAETFEFKWVIGAFVISYVFLVTIFSVIPMAQITKSSIEAESQRRAMTIAQGLSDRFQMSLAAGQANSFDTRFAEREEGVRAAFILQASDGSIIAPVSRAGAYAQEPFVHNARKKDQRWIQQIDSETIGASIPIEIYEPETGLRTPKYYAMVLYNMGSLAVDDGRVVSLFVKVLGIAGLAGLLLFVFLYRLIEAPVRHLNNSLDSSIRTGHGNIESPYNYPSIQKLTLTINSLMSRPQSTSDSHLAIAKDFISEAAQLIRLMSNPALAIDVHGNVIAMNSALASELNVSHSQYDGASFNSLPDDALSTLIGELVERSRYDGALFSTTPMHFRSRDLELNLQPIRGTSGTDYYVVTITDPAGGFG